MKRSLLLLTVLFVFLGCAPYKQLEPHIPLLPEEKGYIELKKDEKKDFEIKEGKQYFIQFPAPKEDNFYLVLSTKQKPVFKDGFTASLVKKKTVGERIKDEAPDLDTLSVYPINTKSPSYFWLFENVSAKQVLSMQYRYVPQWRWKFENYHAEYKDGLKNNRVDRTSYKTIGAKHKFEIFDFPKVIDTVTQHSAELDKILQALLAIESVFPKSILNSNDEAYQNYLKLKKDLDEEIAFQATYLDVMKFFQAEQLTRNDEPLFLEKIDLFLEYFKKKDRLAPNVLAASQETIKPRFEELPPYYDRLLKTKNDANPFDPKRFFTTSFLKVADVYEESGVAMSNEFKLLDSYMRTFDDRASNLLTARQRIGTIRQAVIDLKTMPPDNYFSGEAAKIDAIVNELPEVMGAQFGNYTTLPCTKMLNQGLTTDKTAFSRLAARYRQADLVVVQVNPMLAKMAYPEALGIVAQYRDLDFLLPKYKPLDKLSVQTQKARILDAIEGFRWRESEKLLSDLYRDNVFIDPPSIMPIKKKTVEALEDTLYVQIDRVTRYRVFKFLEANINTVENVDSLYENPVFLPSHDVTFTTGSNRELLNRKARLVEHLAKMKEYEFPKRAVKLLYDEFVKDPDRDGVYRARAIVTHGEHYKGDDKTTKRMVAECNPYASKWIVKPAQYRRVFVTPITTRERGTNTYFFRLNIRIPSDAQFPVYDVNIKLPKNVAKSAGETQWYDKILLNKELLKNEGRFSIGAPTAANGYECQITPVRMKKDKNNHLDVYFKHPSFSVHQVSVMVQKPIIKKN